jgi:hypothetical protein
VGGVAARDAAGASKMTERSHFGGCDAKSKRRFEFAGQVNGWIETSCRRRQGGVTQVGKGDHKKKAARVKLAADSDGVFPARDCIIAWCQACAGPTGYADIA